MSVDQWRQYAYSSGISASSESRARQQAFKRASEYLIGGCHVGGHRLLLELAAAVRLEDERPPRHQIDDAAKVFLFADRQLHRHGGGARVKLEKLPDEDWLVMSQQGLQPVHAGRFYVHTSSNKGKVPNGATSFLIEASRAFGTGGHETTSGCLAMLDRINGKANIST